MELLVSGNFRFSASAMQMIHLCITCVCAHTCVRAFAKETKTRGKKNEYL